MTDQSPDTGDQVASLLGAIIGVALVLAFTAVLVTIGFNAGVAPAAEALGVKDTGTINIFEGLFLSMCAYAMFGRHTLSIARGN